MSERQVPKPSYEYDINRLVELYRKGIDEILSELNRLDVSDMQRAQILATLKNIADSLVQTHAGAVEIAQELLTKAVEDGIVNTIIALGVVETVEEAQNIVKFNKANKALTEAVISDTQADLLAVTQNIERRVRVAVRQVAADSMRANYARGINGRKAISRDILVGLRDKLGASVNTGIIDAAGRRWKPEVYVDMLVRTKTMSAHLDSTLNEAVAREAYYGRVSSHGAKDACRNYEGKIVKLVADAPGDYPYIGDLRGGRDIFHPNCKHLVTPVRVPDIMDSEADKLKVPQGISEDKFSNVSRLIRENVGHISDNIVVQGSRANGTARTDSDIDFAIRVSSEKFSELVEERFKTPNPGSSKEKTMIHAIATGKIQSGEAGLRKLRKHLQVELGIDVDISIIKIDGPFDNPPFIKLP